VSSKHWGSRKKKWKYAIRLDHSEQIGTTVSGYVEMLVKTVLGKLNSKFLAPSRYSYAMYDI
jgi:hypothetical protein